MKKAAFILCVLVLAPNPLFAFTLSNFNTPESFVVDPETGNYYVSNIAGEPTVKDANGFISKISPNGASLIKYFIGQEKNSVLHAPKGLLIVDQDLYVTDIDSVKIFDKRTGKLKAKTEFSSLGAQFLNDLALDTGGCCVYVSDMLADSIFKINPSNQYEPSLYLKSARLGNPNGIRFNPKSRNLIVVTWKTGEILEIDNEKGIHALKRGLTSLDGVDYDLNGNLYVSSFMKGEIYKIPNYGRGTLTAIETGLVTPADISVDRQKEQILVPSFKGNMVIALPI